MIRCGQGHNSGKRIITIHKRHSVVEGFHYASDEGSRQDAVKIGAVEPKRRRGDCSESRLAVAVR